MKKSYFIYVRTECTDIFLVQADTRYEAWVCYLEDQHDYLGQPDGTFRHKGEVSEDLEDVLSHHDLILTETGEVIDPSNKRYETLQEALNAYHVFLQEDGSYISYKDEFSSLSEALKKIYPVYYHLEIGEAVIEEGLVCQEILHSKYESEYLDRMTSEEVAHEHKRQSMRYEALGNLPGAIEEQKKLLALVTDHKSILSSWTEIARLYFESGDWHSAEAYYRQAWEMSHVHDDQERIALHLAEALEKQEDLQSALHYYQLSVELGLQYTELEDKDIQEVLTRMDALKARC